MKNKYQRAVGWVAALFLLQSLLPGGALAAINGTISISGALGAKQVLDHSGSVIAASPPASPTNFLFFSSSPSPLSVTSGFTPAPSHGSYYDLTTGALVDTYDFSGTGKVYVLALASDLVHYCIISTGYKKTTTGGWSDPVYLDLSSTDPSVYFLAGQTTRKKDQPYAPSLGIEESQVRLGESLLTATTLKATVTHVQGVSPNWIDIGGNASGAYAVKIVKNGDEAMALATVNNLTGSPPPAVTITGPSLINQNTGNVFTINGSYLQGGATYTITAWNRNWFTIADTIANTSSETWTLLGGAAAVQSTQSWTLAKSTTGINTIAIPFVTGEAARPIRNAADASIGGTDGKVTVRQLIAAVNALVEGGAPVKVFGWWNEAQQKHYGITSLAYDGTEINANNSKATDANGDSFKNELDVNQILDSYIVTGQPYQISVDQTVVLTLKGYRE
jgi:hypothetical protein